MFGFFQTVRSSDVYDHLEVRNSKTEVIISMTFSHLLVKQEMITQEWDFGFRLLASTNV